MPPEETTSQDGARRKRARTESARERHRTEGRLGRELRALRRARGLTLGQVAEATSISRSFLSLVEAGKSDMTIGRLMALVEFYGVSVGDLLPEKSDADTVAVSRNGQWKLLSSPSEGIRDYLLTPDASRPMLPFVGVFEPGGQNVDYAEHEGDEFAFVLEGRFYLDIKGRPRITLEHGDSVYFPGSLGHSYTNAAKDQSRLLCVVTPPHV